ncbi:polysaccharide pyruvyl transferase family protein [Clostridium sp. BJN0013]|uniref:polysaccharide pyruvyl transferase family protein n=1 Tax=Clostridium sp. BJN0013 TaxID=3236840 RepID=UPI0034C6AC6F
MKIALWGYYGPNYGDNIMLKVIIDYFNNKHIEVEIIDLFGIKGSNTLHTDSKITKFKEFNKVKKLYELYRLSNKDTINIWGGGTIFTDCDGDGNFKFFKLIKLFGGKFSYLGIGIGKLTIKERIEKAIYLLSKCEFAIFRDSSSLKKANDLSSNENYYLAEDLSYIYFNEFKIKKVKYDEYVLITWRNLIRYMDKEQEKKLMNDVVNACSKLCNELNIKNIVLSALDENYDIEGCNVISKMFNDNFNIQIDLDNNIDNITNLICNAKFHFSGRLHGCIASEYFNVPTYGMSYSPKMRYFYESISSNDYFDIYEEKVNYKKIKAIINSKKRYSKSRLLIKSTENFDFLSKLLNNVL